MLSDPDARFIQVIAVLPVPDFRPLQLEPKQNFFEDLNWDLEKFMKGKLREIDCPLWMLSPALYSSETSPSELEKVKQTVPTHSLSYRENNEIGLFMVSRPFKKDAKQFASESTDSSNEFLILWSETTVYLTETSLPCVTRRSRVEQTLSFQTSPLENAIITVRSKTNELLQFEKQFLAIENDMKEEAQSPSKVTIPSSPRSSFTMESKGFTISSSSSKNLNIFTMSLNGAVDAPVNGGIPMYKRAFLDASRRESQDALLCEVLHNAIIDQVILVSNHRPQLFRDAYHYMAESCIDRAPNDTIFKIHNLYENRSNFGSY